MSSSRIERKLAAIMFTDIAGYTEQMSKSESKTLNLLEKKRSILKPLIKHRNLKFFYNECKPFVIESTPVKVALWGYFQLKF